MKSFIKFIAFAACLLVLPATPVRAGDDWVEVRSKNFTFIGNAGDKDIRRVAAKFEQFRAAIKLLFPQANLEKPVPTVVFVFDSHDSFRPFKPRSNGKIEDNVAGYFADRREAAIISMTEEQRGISPYEVIFHEYQHFILDNNFDNAPHWLHEGLAEFYSSFAMNDDGKSFRIGAPLVRSLRTLQRDSMMPLEDLFNYHRKSKKHGNEQAMLYAQSWALTHYLICGNEGRRAAQFDRFISGLNSNVPLAENFQKSFQTDYKTLEKELRQYVGKFTFPVLNFSLKTQLSFDGEMQSRALNQNETEFQLGRLLFYLGEPDLAEKRLQKSVALKDDFAPAHAWLGRIADAQKRFVEAEKSLARAIELDSGDYLAFNFRATVFGRQSKIDEAFKDFARAAEIKPNLAWTHAELASFASATGNDAAAFIAYSKALRLEPRQADYFYSSSHIALRLRRGQPAALQAQNYLRLNGWNDESAPYAALNAYFGFRVAQQPQKARQIADEAAAKIQTTIWASHIFRYLRREITDQDLLKLATDTDKQTEAHAYIALDLTLDGKTAEAVPHFNWVRDKGNREFTEYKLALAELKRLETPPTN